MSDSLITKKALSNSIKELMKTVPLAKISIQSIVDNCKLNRQTFYYHFKDKYDLVNWIYYNEALSSISNYSDYDHWTNGLYLVLKHLYDNKSFYINAINTPGQNSFNDYLFEVTYKLIYNVINDLSRKCCIEETNKKFLADFYTHAFVGITIQWIQSGMLESCENLSKKIKVTVEGTFIDAIKRF